MMEGEFHSLSTIKNLMPGFVPQPYGWGQYKDSPGTYFLLMEFLDLNMGMPDPATFAGLVASLHQESDSPTGKFGFHLPNCHGKIVQANTWDSSWSRYFTRLLISFLEADMATNGPFNPDYLPAFETLRVHVIPRLLEPLQADGRVLKPSLVHGDLWEGNVGTSAGTGNPVVYDASAFYGHHEYELGMWRRDAIAFDRPYFEHYLVRLPPSEPVDEWDDRNRLYSIKFNLAHSVGWMGESDGTRKLILDDVQYLNNKYGPNALETPGVSRNVSW
ncbi:hypothetical protein NKR19_g3084 [Coniochaeta hoffmannii]|uniref:protein-ribulosamine 3-kinase n=1 Tax=Coniochaeta hoffmannii TaxID=91930 RepID=A0AA38W1T3_9PEZI|nr:hypothetical protein NKR19_g3084 [Coniochaeta hoffmannii]